MDQFRGRQFFHGSCGKGMEGWFGDESVHYTYCAVYFYYDYISSTLDQQDQILELRTPGYILGNNTVTDTVVLNICVCVCIYICMYIYISTLVLGFLISLASNCRIFLAPKCHCSGLQLPYLRFLPFLTVELDARFRYQTHQLCDHRNYLPFLSPSLPVYKIETLLLLYKIFVVIK